MRERQKGRAWKDERGRGRKDEKKNRALATMMLNKSVDHNEILKKNYAKLTLLI